MTLNIQHLLLLGVLSASLHWVLARAEVTRFAWSRAPRWLDKLLRCPACSGWWLGLWLWWLGVRPVQGTPHWGELACTGLLAIWLTPVFEACMLWGLEHSLVPDGSAAGYVPGHDDVAEQSAVPACWSCGGPAVPEGTCMACNTKQGALCTSTSCGNAGFVHMHAP